MVQKSQAKMIEKLLLKIKRMKKKELNDDFDIFNMDRVNNLLKKVLRSAGGLQASQQARPS